MLVESLGVRLVFRQDFLVIKLVEPLELKDELAPDSEQECATVTAPGVLPVTDPEPQVVRPLAATASRRPVTEAARLTAFPSIMDAVPFVVNMPMLWVLFPPPLWSWWFFSPKRSTRSARSMTSVASPRPRRLSSELRLLLCPPVLIDRRMRSMRGCEVDTNILLLLREDVVMPAAEAVEADLEVIGGCDTVGGGGSDTNSVRTFDTEGRQVLQDVRQELQWH